MMGPGYWLDPDNGKAWPVSRHEEWLSHPENLKAVNLNQRWIDALAKLDVNKPEDTETMRMVGCQAGLIRVRDYNNRLSIQFYAPRSRVKDYLWAVMQALPKLMGRAHEHYLSINNLYDNASADIWSGDFKQKMKDDEPILRESKIEGHVNDIPYSAALQESVAKLLGDSPV